MNLLLLTFRLVLAAVFLVAGLAKLRDRAGSQQAIRDFGLPGPLAAPLGFLLPLAELAVAVALIPTRSAWLASLAAGGLLVLFILGIGVNLLRGRTPDCHCFGQLHSEPIGPGTIARNGVLLAAAAVIAVEGRSNAGANAVSWLASLGTAAQVGLGLAVIGFAVIALQSWLFLNLLHQNGRLLVRLEALETAGATPTAAPAPPAPPVHGLPVGAPAWTFSLPGLHGETMTLAALLAQGNPALLLFTSPGCGPCSSLLPDVARWQREARDRLTVALIATGSADQNRAKAAEHGIVTVLVQQENEVAEAYRSPGTPSAVLVAADGTIAQPMAVGTDAIRALVNGHLGEAVAAPQPAAPAPLPAPTPAHGPAETVALGMPAPDFNLPDLDGRQVQLAGLRGSETLLLFWNTGCGFCKQMLDELKAWERERPASAPKLVVFSSGPLEDIRAMDLRSTVIPDPSFSYGPRFGANGTPMAVLLDAEARVTSSVAAGGPAVLALAMGEAGRGQLVPLQAELPAPNGQGPTLRRGEPAPALQLPDLDGKTVSLGSFRGRPTLLLFWDTSCGFCQRMLPDLKAWEGKRGKAAPRLLVISAGSNESIRAMGLRSRVVLDPNFTVSARYGANGTPMAVLVDAQGTIASDLLAGAEAILEELSLGSAAA